MVVVVEVLRFGSDVCRPSRIVGRTRLRIAVDLVHGLLGVGSIMRRCHASASKEVVAVAICALVILRGCWLPRRIAKTIIRAVVVVGHVRISRVSSLHGISRIASILVLPWHTIVLVGRRGGVV